MEYAFEKKKYEYLLIYINSLIQIASIIYEEICSLLVLAKNAIMYTRNIDQFGQYLLYISDGIFYLRNKLENLRNEYFV